ncbi:unnamed protein product [Cylindrotheca closterium]|uniref:Uncharacterized protein n=1 Tax=Cylindrotheca closterium TaxID=2856 RepID=A0AAD2CRC4_9STRA|nr:unnamed protein product [Cylindrotheca closterium]
MDSLDDFLETLKVDLESDDGDHSIKSGLDEENFVSKKRRETFTDSMLRDDVVHVVQFTSAASVQSQNRKLMVIGLILILSISGLFRFSKSVVPFFMEATSKVEEKQAVGNR